MERRLYAVLAHPLVRYGVGLLVLVFLLVFLALFLPALVRLAGWPPDFWVLGYGPARLAGYLGALGEAGRRLYALFLRADCLFAPLYGLWLAGWLFHLYHRPAYARAALLAALMDLGENLLLTLQLDRVDPVLAVVAGYLTFFKWVFLAYALLAFLLGLFWQRR